MVGRLQLRRERMINGGGNLFADPEASTGSVLTVPLTSRSDTLSIGITDSKYWRQGHPRDKVQIILSVTSV